MGVKEYFGEYREEIERARVLFSEAVRLKQGERAKQLADELYDITFRHYETLCGFRKVIRRDLGIEQSPPLGEAIRKLNETIDSAISEASDNLNIFGSGINNVDITGLG